jgi:hypothetical protein
MMYSENKWKLIKSNSGVLGGAIKVIDFKPIASHCCRFEHYCGFFM